MNPPSRLLGDEQEERISGRLSYLDVLKRLHHELRPKLYLEIGVRNGGSLVQALGRAIAIDPEPSLRVELPAGAELFVITSDAFFAAPPAGLEPDFAFIDGMHLFENALRDFINVEKCAAEGAVVAIDDVCPNHPAQAERDRRTRVWTGDVWRLAPALQRHRPDLELTLLDTSPTGLLIVSNLDCHSRILEHRFDEIVSESFDFRPIFARQGALDPEGAEIARLIAAWQARRRAEARGD